MNVVSVTGDVLTKEWIMGVRRGWLQLMKPSISDFASVLRAHDQLTAFVERLQDQVLYVRRGPYSGFAGKENDKLVAEIKRLLTAIDDSKSKARHWKEWIDGTALGLQWGEDQTPSALKMLDLYKRDFEDATESGISLKGGRWKSVSLTGLLDRILKILREDAKIIREVEQQGMDPYEPPEAAYKEFSLGRVKVVIDDSTVTPQQIKEYVKLLDESRKRLEKKGFGKLWYGVVFVQCEKCGGANPYGDDLGVAGDYSNRPDTIRIYSRPSNRIVLYMVHELGHRWWFKFMDRKSRLRFQEWVEGGLSPVSDYGGTDFKEAFAEAFAWYVLGRPMTPQQVETFKLVALGRRFSARVYSYERLAGSTGPRPTADKDVVYMPLSEDKFVHFTTRERAERILADGKLRMRPPYEKFGTDTVDAVSTVWGAFVPRVQTNHSKKHADKEGGLVAILFMTTTMPKVGFIEEVKWGQDVVLRRAVIISAEKAQSMLTNAPHQLQDDMTTVVYQQPKTARLVLRYLQAGSVTFDLKAIEKLRKDFLVLVKNVPKVVQRMKADDYTLLDEFRQVVRNYRTAFNRIVFEDLPKAVKSDPNIRSDSEAESILRSIRDSGWAFHGELSWARMDTHHDLTAWDKRVRRKAQVFWKDAKRIMDWYQKLRNPEGISLSAPDRLVLEGFQSELVNFNPAEDYPALEGVRAALRFYRQRASRVLPWLLQNQLPLVIGFQEGADLGGRYRGKDILISGYASYSDPKGLSKTLAHEMGHHLFKHLSASAETFWSSAIRQDYGPLDLREVVAKWPSGKNYADNFVDAWASKDPILALQVDVLSWGHQQRAYRSKDDYENAIAEGQFEESVPKTPITGYAGTNPEESFCEAVGMLVAYGPRAVHAKIRHYLEIVIPGKIKLANESLVDRYLALAV